MEVVCSLSGAQCTGVAQESTLYYPNQAQASFFSGTFFNFIFSGSNLTSDKTTVNSHLKDRNLRHSGGHVLEIFHPEDDLSKHAFCV